MEGKEVYDNPVFLDLEDLWAKFLESLSDLREIFIIYHVDMMF